MMLFDSPIKINLLGNCTAGNLTAIAQPKQHVQPCYGSLDRAEEEFDADDSPAFHPVLTEYLEGSPLPHR